jgi:hypothetical protein
MSASNLTKGILVSSIVLLVAVGFCFGQPSPPNQTFPSSTTPADQFPASKNRDTRDANARIEIIRWIEQHAGVLTLVATVFGFAFVGWQIWQAKKSLNASTYAAIYNQSHAINQLLVDHPEFRDYYYSNIEPRNDEDRLKLLPMTDMFADFFEHIWVQKPHLPGHIWPAWVRYMRYVHENSPILREHCRKNSSWYDADFIQLITEGEDRRASSNGN